MNIREITGYETSRDYKLLVELMKKSSVICIVDYTAGNTIIPAVRRIANTAYTADDDGNDCWWSISTIGICYVVAWGEDMFIDRCKDANVEFLIPNGV